MRVLVIEDNEIDFHIVRRQIRGLRGWEVEVEHESDPFAALEVVKTRSFDAIMLDYKLGPIDGVEVLQTIRQSGIDTPVIMLTAYDCETLEETAREAGADDYLVKDEISAIQLRRAFRYAVGREEAKAELRQFRAAMENAPDGTAFTEIVEGQPGRIRYANPVFQLLTGYPIRELRERLLSDLFAAETSPEQRAAFDDCANRNVCFSGEMVLRRSDQSTFRASLKVCPVMEPGEEARQQVVLLQDITERCERDEQIRDQARMLDLAQDAIIAQDLDGAIVFWNHGAERLFGVASEKALGRKVLDVIQCDGALMENARAETLQKGAWRGELEFPVAGGRSKYLHSHWSLLGGQSNGTDRILMISCDVSRERELQQQAVCSQRMEAIGSLAAGVAHDLNNILSPIIMGASLLREGEDWEAMSDLRQTIEFNAQRGAKLVKQLLTFARGREEENALVQLRHLAKEVHGLAKASCPPTIQLKIDVSPDLWMVRGDPTRLHQVILNLVINARDAMPEGGRLAISGFNHVNDPRKPDALREARPGHFAVIRVTDTGSGIPVDLQRKVFEIFFTTKAENGTGLGLSTVKAIVEQHGGFVQLDSEVGKGSVFTVAIPADPDVAPKEQPEGQSDLTGAGQTVLLVDDEYSIREVVAKTLELHGYQVIRAADGREGLQMFDQHSERIEMVISDILMPEMDGPRMVASMKERRPDLKVLFASAVAKPRETQVYSKSAARLIEIPHLTKPFSVPELLEQLKKMMPAVAQVRR